MIRRITYSVQRCSALNWSAASRLSTQYLHRPTTSITFSKLYQQHQFGLMSYTTAPVNYNVNHDFLKNDYVEKHQLEQLINDNRGLETKDYVLVDVRNVAEVESTGVIESAMHIPLGMLPAAIEMNDDDFSETFKVDKFKKTDHIIFYCLKGKRSEMAVDFARAAGYKNSLNYPGSAGEWFNLP
ncbi:hypothetical protein SAMD00019534_078000, partial [Acytostelium subglobosum LB1]|uniref:hypothetical protein n=1 Tax=Acytostelium subglobosum LB1 TaxID=1410327 RepID=UPI000644A97D